MLITKENFYSIREQGLGNGFTVLNPADGFRKDNRLWFGTCATCGESVTNSSLNNNGWVHNIIVGHIGTTGTVSKNVGYCPMA